jgi:methionyl-tRNA formyltransferase
VDKKEFRIVYFGTPSMSAKVLERLFSTGYNVVGLVAREDKPIGRKGIIVPVPTKLVALSRGIAIHQPHCLREDYAPIKDMKPDILLTFAYGQIIPKAVLDMPRFYPLNLHGSILPKYRGASPIQSAILNGDTVTGVSLMEMVEAMDAGKVFAIDKMEITPDDDYLSLSEKMADVAFKVFDENIQAVIDGTLKGETQDETAVTFTRKITPEDGHLIFFESPQKVRDRMRAFAADPGVYFIYREETIKVFNANIVEGEGEPGTILSFTHNGLKIACKGGAIITTLLQRPGKKKLDISDFYNGNKAFFVLGDKVL